MLVFVRLSRAEDARREDAVDRTFLFSGANGSSGGGKGPRGGVWCRRVDRVYQVELVEFRMEVVRQGRKRWAVAGQAKWGPWSDGEGWIGLCVYRMYHSTNVCIYIVV